MKNFIIISLILMVVIKVSIALLKVFLSSSILRSMVYPITNKNIKNRLINVIVIYRVNYFNYYRITDFDKDIYNKIINRQFLNKSELMYLNKNT